MSGGEEGRSILTLMMPLLANSDRVPAHRSSHIEPFVKLEIGSSMTNDLSTLDR